MVATAPACADRRDGGGGAVSDAAAAADVSLAPMTGGPMVPGLDTMTLTVYKAQTTQPMARASYYVGLPEARGDSRRRRWHRLEGRAAGDREIRRRKGK